MCIFFFSFKLTPRFSFQEPVRQSVGPREWHGYVNACFMLPSRAVLHRWPERVQSRRPRCSGRVRTDAGLSCCFASVVRAVHLQTNRRCSGTFPPAVFEQQLLINGVPHGELADAVFKNAELQTLESSSYQPSEQPP